MQDLPQDAEFGENGAGRWPPGEEVTGLIGAAIVDDHPVARLGLARILGESGRVRVTAAVGTAAELSGHLQADAPDVVVCDLYHAGEGACLDVVAALAATVRVLVISASARPADVIGAVCAGASGYIIKHVDSELLLAAVETVAAGGFVLSLQLADILQAGLAAPTRRSVLSPGRSRRSR